MHLVRPPKLDGDSGWRSSPVAESWRRLQGSSFSERRASLRGAKWCLKWWQHGPTKHGRTNWINMLKFTKSLERQNVRITVWLWKKNSYHKPVGQFTLVPFFAPPKSLLFILVDTNCSSPSMVSHESIPTSLHELCRGQWRFVWLSTTDKQLRHFSSPGWLCV